MTKKTAIGVNLVTLAPSIVERISPTRTPARSAGPRGVTVMMRAGMGPG
jgi:hypothetical protein